jgi:hypothetical protein
MTTVLLTLVVVVAALVIVLVGGLIRLRSLRRAAFPGTVSAAHPRDIVGRAPGGPPVIVDVASSSRPTMLLFLTSTCTTCASFWRALGTHGADAIGDARLVVVTKGEEAERPSRLRELAEPAIPVVMSSEAWDAYGVAVAPHFVYLAGGEVLAAGGVETWEQVATVGAHGDRPS